MTLKGAIFDMDGTLLDSLGFWERHWKNFGKKYLGIDDYRIPESLDAAIRTCCMEETVQIVCERFKIGEDETAVLQWFNDSLWDYYCEQAKLKPGVPELLESLRKSGVKMCIASATNAGFVRKLAEMFRIYDYFEGIVSCSDPDVGQGKDSLKVYEKAIRLLGTPIAETAVYEDSFVALETAKKMGFHTVGVIDSKNFGHDRLRAAADIIIEEGDPFDGNTDCFSAGN